jgi:hypothetical protein
VKAAALGLKFICELMAFAALGYLGATTGPVAANVLLGAALPLAAIFIWAQWCAPKAPKRLRNPALTVVEMTIFLIAAVAMFVSIAPWLGVLYAIVVIANERLLHRLGLDEA